MAQSLETRGGTSVSRRPARLDDSTARALASAALGAASGSIREERLPAALRARLERRREDVALALRPAPRERIAAVLASLDGMVARGESDAAEAEFAFRRDVEDLVGAPEWALEAAAAAFRRGEVGEGKFRPTAGELRREASRRAAGYAEEAAKIERVLRARIEAAPAPLGPERRRRLAEALRGALADASLDGEGRRTAK